MQMHQSVRVCGVCSKPSAYSVEKLRETLRLKLRPTCNHCGSDRTKPVWGERLRKLMKRQRWDVADRIRLDRQLYGVQESRA